MVLSYKFLEVETPKGIIRRPYLPVTLQYQGFSPLDTMMMVDSGADFSMIERAIAEQLSVPVERLPLTTTSGVSGSARVAEAEMHIKFGQRAEVYETDIPVQIPLRRGFPRVPLLGREPLFRDFDVQFRMGYADTKGKFTIKPVTRRRPGARYK